MGNRLIKEITLRLDNDTYELFEQVKIQTGVDKSIQAKRVLEQIIDDKAILLECVSADINDKVRELREEANRLAQLSKETDTKLSEVRAVEDKIKDKEKKETELERTAKRDVAVADIVWKNYMNLKYDDGCGLSALTSLVRKDDDLKFQCSTKWMNTSYEIRGKRILEQWIKDGLSLGQIIKREPLKNDGRGERGIRYMTVHNMVIIVCKAIRKHGRPHDIWQVFGGSGNK